MRPCQLWKVSESSHMKETRLAYLEARAALLDAVRYLVDERERTRRLRPAERVKRLSGELLEPRDDDRGHERVHDRLGLILATIVAVRAVRVPERAEICVPLVRVEARRCLGELDDLLTRGIVSVSPKGPVRRGGTHLERVPQRHLDTGPELPDANEREATVRIVVLLAEAGAPLVKLTADAEVRVAEVVRLDVREQAGEVRAHARQRIRKVSRVGRRELVVGPARVLRRDAVRARGAARGAEGGPRGCVERCIRGGLFRGWDEEERRRDGLAREERDVVRVVRVPPAGDDVVPLLLDRKVALLDLL